MQLDTFLRKLETKPINLRYDHYEDKHVLEFEKRDGYFPYIELQAKPTNGKQKLYFDVLNWEMPKDERYVDKPFVQAKGFIMLSELRKDN